MRKKLLAGVAGAALTVGVGLGVTQLAQAETPSPTPTPSACSPAPRGDVSSRGHVGGREHGHVGATSNLSELATTLGVPVEELSDALSAARDQLRSERSGTNSPREDRRDALAKALAAELGIEEDEVLGAFADMQAERHAERTGRGRTTLDSAVADGTLTQDEADVVQKALDAGILSTRGGSRGHR